MNAGKTCSHVTDRSFFIRPTRHPAVRTRSSEEPGARRRGSTMEGQIRSTHRRFCLAKLVSFDHSSDAHVIDAALRNLFDAHHSSPPAYECTRDLRTLPGRHNRKSDFHSYSEPPADPRKTDRPVNPSRCSPADTRYSMRSSWTQEATSTSPRCCETRSGSYRPTDRNAS